MTGVPTILYVASFGYHHRQPPPANAVIDVGWMPNPFKHPDYHDLSGLDQPVQDWLFEQPRIGEWFEATMTALFPHIAAAETKHSHAVTWAFGCAGGHDRSVAVAEFVAEAMRRAGQKVFVDHLDIHHRGGVHHETGRAVVLA
jgi:UPF0042 nucleotide-binding protein